MNRVLALILALLGLAAVAVSSCTGAESEAVRYYVQLIRGTDDPKPPDKDSKPVGPRLSKCLSTVFRWKSYWEINRRVTTLQPGKTSKLHLNDGRDLELEFASAEQVEIRLLRNGSVARKTRRPVFSKGLEIMGGTQGDDNSWFIVVRQDVPQNPGTGK